MQVQGQGQGSYWGKPAGKQVQQQQQHSVEQVSPGSLGEIGVLPTIVPTSDALYISNAESEFQILYYVEISSK